MDINGGLELLERVKQSGGILSAGGHQQPLIDSVQGEADDSKYIGTINQLAITLHSSQSQELPSMRLRP
jgi:hypothetical protein